MKIILDMNMNKEDPHNRDFMQKTCTRSHSSCGRRALGSTIDCLWNKTVSSTWIYMQPIQKQPSAMNACSKVLGSYWGHQYIRVGILARGPWEVCYDRIPPCWNWNIYTVQLENWILYLIFGSCFSKLSFFFNTKGDLNVGLLNLIFGLAKVCGTFIMEWMHFSLWEGHEPMDLVGYYYLKWFLKLGPGDGWAGWYWCSRSTYYLNLIPNPQNLLFTHL